MKIGQQLKFAYLPKRCRISNKLIWLKYGYVVTLMYTGPGQPVFEYFWYTKSEFLVQKLKGNL